MFHHSLVQWVRNALLVGEPSHVETIVVLSKGIDISAGKVQVEFSVEDMDLSAAHGNASYNKIKKHVYEKTGLQVSNLNI